MHECWCIIFGAEEACMNVGVCMWRYLPKESVRLHASMLVFSILDHGNVFILNSMNVERLTQGLLFVLTVPFVLVSMSNHLKVVALTRVPGGGQYIEGVLFF